MCSTNSNYIAELFRWLLEEELGDPERFEDREWDAIITYDREAVPVPEHLAAMGMSVDDTYVFFGYIFPVDDDTPVALMPFYGTGDIARRLRDGFLDDSLIEDEEGEEVLIRVHLKRRSGTYLKNKNGTLSEEFVCNLEIMGYYAV